MKSIEKQITDLFTQMNGANFVGVRAYKNSNNEIADHVIIADFSYRNAVNKTVEILNTLTDADFTAMADKYSVNNVSGILYSNSVQGKLYLTDGKLPKEGTKARETVLNSVKTSKSLAEMRNEMVAQYIANQDVETRSAQSQAHIDAFIHITNSIKLCVATKQIHIYALHVSKNIIQEGEYEESNPKPETLQKNAIFAYCKYQLNKELPTAKYRSFIVEVDQMASVKAQGEEIIFA